MWVGRCISLGGSQTAPGRPLWPVNLKGVVIAPSIWKVLDRLAENAEGAPNDTHKTRPDECHFQMHKMPPVCFFHAIQPV